MNNQSIVYGGSVIGELTPENTIVRRKELVVMTKTGVKFCFDINKFAQNHYKIISKDDDKKH